MKDTDKKPIISVIVPVYNSELFLEKCINSITTQSYANLEIVLIDDGSTDGSVALCDSYGEKDERIKVVHQKNSGVSKSRNNGLDLITGSYVTFVDSDDWIEPSMIEELYDALCRYKADFSECAYYKNKGSSEESELRYDIETFLTKEQLMKDILSGKAMSVVWGKLYKKSIFDDGIRFPNNRVYEDTRIVPEIGDRCTSSVYLSRALYHYLLHEKSITHTITMRNSIDFWLAHKELYDCYSYRYEEYKVLCVNNCLIAAMWVLSQADSVYESQNQNIGDILRDINKFAHSHKKEVLSLSSAYSWKAKARIIIACHQSRGMLKSYQMAHKLVEKVRALNNR